MKHEEAIKILTELKPIPIDGFKIIAKAYDLAIEALEKQIPKKPPNHDRMVCPSCNSKARYGHPYEYYCPHCGQAILWEVSE